MINHKLNNRIKIRNPSESCDSHDLVKILLGRMLRRNHPDMKHIGLYSEFNSEKDSDNFPDLQLDITKLKRGRKRKEVYSFEIQKNLSKEWQKKTEESYLDMDQTPVIVDLKLIDKLCEKQMGISLEEFVKGLRKILIAKGYAI